MYAYLLIGWLISLLISTSRCHANGLSLANEFSRQAEAIAGFCVGDLFHSFSRSLTQHRGHARTRALNAEYFIVTISLIARILLFSITAWHLVSVKQYPQELSTSLDATIYGRTICYVRVFVKLHNGVCPLLNFCRKRRGNVANKYLIIVQHERQMFA